MSDMRQESYSPVSDFLGSKATHAKVPLYGTFELSPLCNFNCRMCYVHKTAQEVAASEYPMMTYDEWVELGRQAKEAGMLFLLLTGGEPLLWPRFWDLYDELYDMGLILQVNTNGSLIDEKAIAHWQKRPPQRLNITLYGASDETYEALCGVKHVFTRVRDNILALKKADILVKLNCSVTPQNAVDLEAICHFARENGLFISPVAYMFPPVRRDASMVGQNDRFTPEECAWYHMQRFHYLDGEEHYKLFLQSIVEGMTEPLGLDDTCVDSKTGKVRCKAARASYWVTWDGFMTPCGMMPEPKLRLSGHEFSEVWSQMVEIGNQMRVSSTCEKCPDQRICNSCAAMAIAETGRSDGIPTYLCEMARSMKQLAERELSKYNG